MTARKLTPFKKKQVPIPSHAISNPAAAGPSIRALLNIIELSAIALARSSYPTISTTNDCRPGMSNDPMVPLNAARMITYSTRTVPVQVSVARVNALSISKDLGDDYQAAPIDAVDDHAGEQADHQNRGELREGDDAEHQRGIRQLQNQPRLRGALHPGAGERNELAEEVEAIVAMAKRAKRSAAIA